MNKELLNKYVGAFLLVVQMNKMIIASDVFPNAKEVQRARDSVLAPQFAADRTSD